MKKRFVVCIDSSTKEQHDLFREFIRNEGLAWWHWVTNVWLLVDRKGQFSASDIRDQVSRCYPNVDALVLELRADDDSWSGFGPKTDQRNMFTWLKDHWNR